MKIADFGLAKVLGQNAPLSLTESHQAVGTPLYMAPEQLGGASVDHRADIYSLGVVLYELLTGDLPIGRFPPPSSKAPDSDGLDAVVLRSLESAPEARYQQARDVKSALQGGAPAVERRSTSPKQRTCDRHREQRRQRQAERRVLAAADGLKRDDVPAAVPWGSWGLFALLLASCWMSWGALPFRGGQISLTAWNSYFSPGGLQIPSWFVLVLGAIVASLRTARNLGTDLPRTPILIAAGAGVLMTSSFQFLMVVGGAVEVGIGPVVALACFVGWLVAEYPRPRQPRRRRHTRRAAATRTAGSRG